MRSAVSRGPLPGPLREGSLFQPAGFASGGVVGTEAKRGGSRLAQAPVTLVTKTSDKPAPTTIPDNTPATTPATIPATEDVHEVDGDDSTSQEVAATNSERSLPDGMTPLFSRLGIGVAHSLVNVEGHKSASLYDNAATDAAVLAVRDALGKTPVSLDDLAEGGNIGSLVVRVRLGIPPTSKEEGATEGQSSSPLPTQDEGEVESTPKVVEKTQSLSLRKVDLALIERSVAPFARLLRPIRVSLGGLSDPNDFEKGNVCVIAAVTVGRPKDCSRRSSYEQDTFSSPILRPTVQAGIPAAGLYPGVNAPPLSAPLYDPMHRAPVSPQVRSFLLPDHSFIEGSPNQIDRNTLAHNFSSPQPSITTAQRNKFDSVGVSIDSLIQKSRVPQVPQWAGVLPILPAEHNIGQDRVSRKRAQDQLSSPPSPQQSSEMACINPGSDLGSSHKIIRQKHPEYHDHIDEVPTKPELAQFGELIRSLKLLPFPLRLHRLLDEHQSASTCGHSGAFGWLSHGRAFRVYDVPAFVSQVLPEHFRLTKYCSFLRQLNLYGFRRIGTGPDRGSYYHELFLRGMPVLASRMRRTRVNGNGTRRAADPDTEPDFYAMSPVPRALPMQVDDTEEDAATAEMKMRLGEVSTVLQAAVPRHSPGAERAPDRTNPAQPESDLHPVTSSLAQS